MLYIPTGLIEYVCFPLLIINKQTNHNQTQTSITQYTYNIKLKKRC